MNLCIVIPNYNHTHAIDQVLAQLCGAGYNIVMVDDGSHGEAQSYFDELAPRYPQLTLLRHQVNQGKGGAVQTGLRWAYENGYSHALQVDADGQHCIADIDRLVECARNNPEAIISGRPVYDDSVPKHRYLSRYITHVWVWIETLSLSIKDSMCGFRVYPLAPCMALFERCELGKRMDFDIEIMVRMYWRGTPSRFVDTQVIYPEDGVSHFQPLADNVKISWLHTRLFFGMLVRLPKLLWHKFSGQR
ncbi:glycosyltransferase family 2 protein [Pseudoalteromonas sp. BDTF-M6]|uniref:glycosyltransferase family 2 protein n=1 Tax=Pseudoalteromonas sp. BDTF-M6 TaxID=2796132 RepID=UPI001BB0C875|nr:glycosyltransferase family 2 protein [Pseudoalteromonas sp. BDTF-M6]MBS3797719.1 glycosyltransferase family 2 protein [Pseudoalteromonas sp. BDTF-M6]